MTHFTILREEQDPKESFTLSSCDNCDYGCNPSRKNYHCPLCLPSKFKPKPYLSTIKKHLESHFIGERKVVLIKGYKISICSLVCINQEDAKGQSHFHCPFCSELVLKKNSFISHVQSHSPSASASKNEKTPVRSRNGADVSFCSRIDRLNMSLNATKLNNGLDISSENVRLDVSLNAAKLNNGLDHSSENVTMGESSTKENIQMLIRDYKRTGNFSFLEKRFEFLRKEVDTTAKLTWVAEMTEGVKYLDRKADKIVVGFMKLLLFSCQELADATTNFIRTLVVQHNYYAYHVLKSLFHHLVPTVEEDGDLLINGGYISKDEAAVYNRVISAIITINSDIPMTQQNLLILARKSMPYFQLHVHKHAVYTRNLLFLASYLPHLRLSVLEVIIAKYYHCCQNSLMCAERDQMETVFSAVLSLHI